MTLVFEVVLVPLQAFTPAVIWQEGTISMLLRFFWTLDIPVTFLTGVFGDDGHVRYSCRHVAMRYATSWFIFDFVLVAMSWSELVTETMSGLRLGRMARMGRLLRLLRLARLFKLPQIMRSLSDRLLKEGNIVAFAILRALVCLCLCCHVCGCLWYYVGELSMSSGRHSWLVEHHLRKESFLVQYLAALQWAFAHFMQSEPNITSHSAIERAFNITIILFGFLLSSIFVSSVVSSMMRLNILGSRQEGQFSRLRQYLQNHDVSSRLSVLITHSIHQTLELQKRSVLEPEIELLPHLSEDLLLELHFEIHGRLLLQNRFICGYWSLRPDLIRRICHCAVKVWHASRGERLFRAGKSSVAPSMFFHLSGMLSYRKKGAPSQSYVQKSECLVEAVLWTNFEHVGTLLAVSQSAILTLDAKEFQKIVSLGFGQREDGEVESSMPLVLRYAQTFVALLKDLPYEEVTDLDEDLGKAAWKELMNFSK